MVDIPLRVFTLSFEEQVLLGKDRNRAKLTEEEYRVLRASRNRAWQVLEKERAAKRKWGVCRECHARVRLLDSGKARIHEVRVFTEFATTVRRSMARAMTCAGSYRSTLPDTAAIPSISVTRLFEELSLMRSTRRGLVNTGEWFPARKDLEAALRAAGYEVET
jgi:hypothetical protein